jgi:hypothetical protein
MASTVRSLPIENSYGVLSILSKEAARLGTERELNRLVLLSLICGRKGLFMLPG